MLKEKRKMKPEEISYWIFATPLSLIFIVGGGYYAIIEKNDYAWLLVVLGILNQTVRYYFMKKRIAKSGEKRK